MTHSSDLKNQHIKAHQLPTRFTKVGKYMEVLYISHWMFSCRPAYFLQHKL
jgi:hypothetical protein